MLLHDVLRNKKISASILFQKEKLYLISNNKLGKLAIKLIAKTKDLEFKKKINNEKTWTKVALKIV
jgi:hypothetical protein